MNMHLRYGIIGCGMMGHEHLRNLGLFSDCAVTAIYEPDKDMQESASQLCPDAKFYDSVSSLLDHQEMDCLLIASPNFCHAAQIVEISQKRPLPMLVEKPLFTDPRQAGDLIAACKAYPAPIWVGMEYRYMPPMAKFIDEAPGATGGITMLTICEHRFPFLQKVGNWNRFNRNSGGTFVEKCCHFFDLMRLILNSEPRQIMASAGQSHNHLDETYVGERSDIWDNGYVIVDFENGARALLELCMFAEGSEFQESVSAVGPMGKIECFVPGPSRFWPEDLQPEPLSKIVLSPRHPKRPVSIDVPINTPLLKVGDHHGSTYYQHIRFQEVLRGKADVEVSWHDGLMAVAMGMAAQQSASSGQVINMSEFLHDLTKPS
ncbi:Gfo/Idh/MocA family oxidoreductase [Alphaproteobacteria bacterium]|nr:Gfo/Idh/MocA family oxidoreductase [Alphaproteobacteria bacterium]